MTQKRPTILVSNDDGIDAQGIRSLSAALRELDADVFVVAPTHEQSAMSHALSLHRPLRVRERSERDFAIDGTPADCVYVATHHSRILQGAFPDLVVSGVNHGPNLGKDVAYSGTVAAAREGAIRGVRALAVSYGGTPTKAAMDEVASLAKRIAITLLETSSDGATLLNLNVPALPYKGVRKALLGVRRYDETVVERDDPRGRPYVWIGGPGPVENQLIPETDAAEFEKGFATLTPLRVDTGAAEHLDWTGTLLNNLKQP